MPRCNQNHKGQRFKNYIYTNYCNMNVLVLVRVHLRFSQLVVSTEETTLIGRISDVVRSGRGSDFAA